MSRLFDDNFPNMSPVWSRLFTLEVESASGSWITAADGRRFLDFTCGIGVTNTGHCHPKVVAAIAAQAGKFIHAQANIVIHRPMLELIAELKAILPPTLDGFFFSSSGAEAVEGAIKLARAVTGRQSVVVFNGSFHGRTGQAMALTTSKAGYRGRSQLMPSGVHVSPYPYPLRLGMSPEASVRFALDSLDELFASQVAPTDVAAILIEPVLGEGGYVEAPTAFLAALRALCDRHGIMLVFDEIQSGFGRTGAWFSFDRAAVIPDILTLAKGIASGLPLSAVISKLDYMKKWPTGSHGGTFGGNAVAMAAGVATLRAMREEGMPANAAAMGERLRAGLCKLAGRHPALAEVRGPGLMVGTEFVVDGSPRNSKALVKANIAECEARELLLLNCGTWDSTIRWIPPLNVSAKEIDRGLTVFGEALAAAKA
ncbi:MAG: aminotransferase class III-fold pyridoxal phosphate-dependent enzyme [Spirochaetota bacterium]